MELERRRLATQATLDAFRGVQFDWSAASCGHLLHTHLINMGHTPPPLPEYHTPAGVLRALKGGGWSSVADYLDSMLERRRAPSFMITGDIALAPGDGIDAILICAGPLKLFGWLEGAEELVVIQTDLDALIGCWAT